MKEEDRQSMITHHREKAHHILEQADLMMTMEQWDASLQQWFSYVKKQTITVSLISQRKRHVTSLRRRVILLPR